MPTGWQQDEDRAYITTGYVRIGFSMFTTHNVNKTVYKLVSLY